jgi:hypothetical protein
MGVTVGRFEAFGAACLAALALGLGACGDDDEEPAASAPEESSSVSSSDLLAQLPAADALNREVDRQYEWENATDFVVQGVIYSETTPPSELIGPIEDAGFEAGAITGYFDSDHRSLLRVLIAEFDSEEGAAEARDLLHAEDLKQPCFAACTVTPQEYEVEGIPNSTAVHQVPIEGDLPPDAFPFEAYLLEFTEGSTLYSIYLDGEPGFASEEEFDETALTVYEELGLGAG